MAEKLRRRVSDRHEANATSVLSGLAKHATYTSIAHAQNAVAECQAPGAMGIFLKDQVALAELLEKMLGILTQLKFRPLAIRLAEGIVDIAQGLAEYECHGHTAAIDTSISMVTGLLRKDAVEERKRLEGKFKTTSKRKVA